MKVTAQNHDEVSALLTVTVDRADYKDSVEKQLHNYAKNAQIPGFRKGKVPMSMVKRQYEAPLSFEEINKTISEGIKGYVADNELRLVGQPIPVNHPNTLDYKAEQFSLDFEVGFEPKFNINIEDHEATHYKVEASDKEINKSIENMQRRFAEREDQDKATKDSYIGLSIKQIVEENAEGEHNHPATKSIISKEEKEAFELVKKLKKEDSVKISKEDLQNKEELAKQLGFTKEQVEALHHNELEISVTDIYKLNLHELNQELFDKVYGEGNIKSEQELKDKVKTELDEYFQQNADNQFVNSIVAKIKEVQDLQLPEAFFIKSIMFNNPNVSSEDQAKELFEKEKNLIVEEIIQNRLFADNQIDVKYDEILSHTEQMIKNQLAMYGIHELPEDELKKYASEVLKDSQQLQNIISEISSMKLRDVILEKAKKNETKVSHDEFLEIINK